MGLWKNSVQNILNSLPINVKLIYLPKKGLIV